MSFKGAIFDLDGVLVNTVPLHFKAWKRMFSEFGKEFDFEDYKEKVDGIPRSDGARAILGDIPKGKLKEATNKKQKYYLQYIQSEGVPVYETSVKLIKELRASGIKIAVISSSKNCSHILKETGLYDLVDVEVSGYDITKGKPDPQIFLLALKKLKLSSRECVVFEDASLGVEAAKRAGVFTVGVDRYRKSERLKKADLIVEDLAQINYEKLRSLLEA